MATIAFIGLGNMGGGMCANLVQAGHAIRAFDLSQAAVKAAIERGAGAAGGVAEAVVDCDAVVTMLPAGQHVRDVYGDVFTNAPASALLIDCSTIDVDSARAVEASAADKGFAMVDAPVSGGVAAAEGGTLTFMVGGGDGAFASAEPILSCDGQSGDTMPAGPEPGRPRRSATTCFWRSR